MMWVLFGCRFRFMTGILGRGGMGRVVVWSCGDLVGWCRCRVGWCRLVVCV